MSAAEILKEEAAGMMRPRDERKTPEVSVIVVTYNSAAVILGCLAAVATDGRLEVVVVDNASTDSTVEIVRSASCETIVIENKVNLGFARAVNIGAAQARGKCLLLLNPDATLIGAAVIALSEVLLADPNIGAIAPLLDHPSGRLAIREGGRSPSAWRVFTHYSGLSRLATRWPFFEGLYLLDRAVGDADIDVDWISGASLMVDADTWRSLDGLSERWFMYAEDIELCLRLRASGMRVVITPSISGTHGLGKSTGGPPSMNPAWVVNMFELYRTSISPSNAHNFLWKLLMGGGLVSRAIGFHLRARTDEANASAWSTEAKRFQAFAVAVAREPITKGII